MSPCRKALEGWREESCTAPGNKKRLVEGMQTVGCAVWKRDLKKRIAEGTEKWAYVVSIGNTEQNEIVLLLP